MCSLFTPPLSSSNSQNAPLRDLDLTYLEPWPRYHVIFANVVLACRRMALSVLTFHVVPVLSSTPTVPILSLDTITTGSVSPVCAFWEPRAWTIILCKRVIISRHSATSACLVSKTGQLAANARLGWPYVTSFRDNASRKYWPTTTAPLRRAVIDSWRRGFNEPVKPWFNWWRMVRDSEPGISLTILCRRILDKRRCPNSSRIFQTRECPAE